jgi:hypothetical protein
MLMARRTNSRVYEDCGAKETIESPVGAQNAIDKDNWPEAVAPYALSISGERLRSERAKVTNVFEENKREN